MHVQAPDAVDIATGMAVRLIAAGVVDWRDLSASRLCRDAIEPVRLDKHVQARDVGTVTGPLPWAAAVIRRPPGAQ